MYEDPYSREVWKPIKGLSGYEVSSFGRGRSFWIQQGRSVDRAYSNIYIIGDTPQPIRDSKVGRNGYREFRFKCGTPILIRRKVHHVVLEAFVGPCPSGLEGCHYPDSNPANNRLDNLRWDTRAANSRVKVLSGSLSFAVLTEADVRAIWFRLLTGESQAVLGQIFNVHRKTISAIRNKRSWSHITENLPQFPQVDIASIEPVYVPVEFRSVHEEFWKPIEGWPGYDISSWGRVHSFHERRKRGITATATLMKLKPGEYPRVTLTASDGRQRLFQVSRLLLTAFAGLCPIGMEACHEDNDPWNNHASNLRWDTKKGNAKDKLVKIS